MISLFKHFCIFYNIFQNHIIFIFKAWFVIIPYQKQSKYFYNPACRRKVLFYMYVYAIFLISVL